MIIQLLLIQVIICYIIDLSGVIQSIESYASKMTGKKIRVPRPFSCSLCTGWWLGLLYLIITHNLTIFYIFIIAMISFLSKNITGLLIWVQEMLIAVEQLLYKMITKPYEKI